MITLLTRPSFNVISVLRFVFSWLLCFHRNWKYTNHSCRQKKPSQHLIDNSVSFSPTSHRCFFFFLIWICMYFFSTLSRTCLLPLSTVCNYVADTIHFYSFIQPLTMVHILNTLCCTFIINPVSDYCYYSMNTVH